MSGKVFTATQRHHHAPLSITTQACTCGLHNFAYFAVWLCIRRAAHYQIHLYFSTRAKDRIMLSYSHRACRDRSIMIPVNIIFFFLNIKRDLSLWYFSPRPWFNPNFIIRALDEADETWCEHVLLSTCYVSFPTWRRVSRRHVSRGVCKTRIYISSPANCQKTEQRMQV